ncbi:MAG: hypothetical protein LBP75_10905 [Planctomycetota bacterium]|jgi:hypothetical protein|nr:hypothetical protein [Planctomycetota bacterium]
MKWQLAVGLMMATITLACTAPSNSTVAPAAAPTTAGGETIHSQADASLKNGRTIININAPQSAPLPNSTVVQTGYQTVYTTEYGPLGPMVKKAMIPVYSAAPAPVAAPIALLPVPTGEGIAGAPIIVQQNIMGQPPLVGFPPAQPVVPAIVEPSAWFGPAASPNAYYSQQTRWY